MREINYDNGSIDGDLNEWDRAGKQVTKDHYDDGRRLATKTEYFPNRTKKSEGTVLYPRLVLENPDDWFDCTLATYTQEGEPEKHGPWVSWYPNGQRKLSANYEHDEPTGEFIWWHENGQKSLLAHYKDGKKDGDWIWWYANGQRSIQGVYDADDPTQKWLWWNDNGKVAQRADFSDPKQRQMLAMPQEESLGSPNAAKAVVNRALK
jgi:antitoxin component YwqK of YwqJK toxin-antitoxin module